MKKIVSAVLASFFIFSGVSANPIKTNAITEKNIRLVGDINVDGKIDAVDASGILTTYAKLSVEGGDMKDMNLECISNRYVADVNNDGRIDGVDASLVLTKYAASSVGKDVEYEVLVIAKENIQIGYDSQDVLRFIGDSWNVHTTPELGSHNIYQKKKKLSKNDIVYVLSQTSDYWYYAIVDGSETAVFVRVLPEEMNNFEKIGKLSDYTANLLVTTKPITTKLTTTTTTTTTATSSSTRITTTGSTTSQITTNSNQTNKVFSVNDEVIFTEKSWSLYHTREVKDEPDDFLYRKVCYELEKELTNLLSKRNVESNIRVEMINKNSLDENIVLKDFLLKYPQITFMAYIVLNGKYGDVFVLDLYKELLNTYNLSGFSAFVFCAEQDEFIKALSEILDLEYFSKNMLKRYFKNEPNIYRAQDRMIVRVK